jgi:hypothetical protein
MTEILIDKSGHPKVITASDGCFTVSIPIRIKRRGLRKAVILPDGGVEPRPWDSTPTPPQLALARGHRRMNARAVCQQERLNLPD